MAFGLSTFNSSGQVLVDNVDRIPRFISEHAYSMAANVADATVTVAGVGPTTHFVYDKTNSLPCVVQSGSLKVTRCTGLSPAISGTLVLFRM